MKKVLVVGATGMLASRFITLAKSSLEITGVDEKILDITNKEAVNEYFSINNFDAVINFAAYTNVDGAEKERGVNGLVWKLNVEGVRNLIEACNNKNIFLIQISTDFVFDTNGPFDESAKPSDSLNDNIGWYGWTKRIAEKDFLESNVKGAIVRITYPFTYASYDLKLDWAKNLIKLYNEQKLYPLFQDQIYSILLIEDLTQPLVKIINDNLTGVFHIASSDTTTPYESGKYLLDKYTGRDIEIKKGSIDEFMKSGNRAPRPKKGGLKTSKTENILGMSFRSWKQMVDDFVDQYKASSV